MCTCLQCNASIGAITIGNHDCLHDRNKWDGYLSVDRREMFVPCAIAITANCQAHCVVLSHQVSLNAYACQPCRQDVTRMLSKSYASRWRETTSKRSACCLIDCTDDVFVSLHKGSLLLKQGNWDTVSVKSQYHPNFANIITTLCTVTCNQCKNINPTL